MALSKDYTAKTFWRSVSRDLNLATNNKLRPLRFELSNRGIVFTAGQVYDLVKQAYMTEETPILGATAREGANGAFVAATGLLTCAMDSNFINTDLGNTVNLYKAGAGYTGTIDRVDAVNIVRLVGGSLPSADLAAITRVTMLPTTPVGGDVISIAALRLMRSHAHEIILESTLTKNIEPVAYDRLKRFDTKSALNRTRIEYTVMGDNCYLKKADPNFVTGALASYGTLTFHFPRIPYLLTADADLVDLPDGPVIQLAILYTGKLCREQLGMAPKKDEKAEFEMALRRVYEAFKGGVETQALKQKVLAFM